MVSTNSIWLRRLSGIFLATLMFLSTAAFAQDNTDPDPNSPTPVLLSENDSTRALVSAPNQRKGRTAPLAASRAFALGNKINLFASNIALMDGEGVNAFRINVEDAAGRAYRFPVIEMQRVKGDDGVYQFTVLLRDELGFWTDPLPDGDVLVALTWRGLSSNRVRLGLGATGGSIKDDPGAVPTPRGASAAKISSPNTADYIGYRYSGDRKRFLEQATFGPTVDLDQQIRRIGIRTWLAQQFEASYPSLNNPYPDISLKSTNQNDVTLGCGANDGSAAYRICIRDYYSMYPVQKWFYTEAFYGDSQLRHRVSWALDQMWVISGSDTQQSSWMITYQQAISKNAFGNFKTLIKDMTLNPGMGNYLDMVRSTKANPNENYAREIMQLFTVGLYMLNQDGTLQRDASNNPIPTYDQTAVTNLTKVLTGWTFCNVGCVNSLPGIVNYKDPLILNQTNHDVTAKTLLAYPNAVNQNIPANQNGAAELDLAIDNIFYHPNLGPTVGKFLIQHLVTSNPTPAYVGRVAAAFNNNGLGVRGDMKAVVRAILTDPEARGDVKTDPNYGKLREPVQLVTNIARQFDVKSANLGGPSDGVVNNLASAIGQNAFNSPTVFNFYPPDYMIPGTALPGPEFAIMTTSTSIGRANLGNSMVYSQIGVSENAPAGTKIDLTAMQALVAADPSCNRLLDVLNDRMLGGTMSADMRQSILTAITSIAASSTLARAQGAVYLVATSSQYQVQR
ncbi:MAG: DUF1800 domain-containing protein [Pyrinomonadaceae bacterium]